MENNWWNWIKQAYQKCLDEHDNVLMFYAICEFGNGKIDAVLMVSITKRFLL